MNPGEIAFLCIVIFVVAVFACCYIKVEREIAKENKHKRRCFTTCDEYDFFKDKSSSR